MSAITGVYFLDDRPVSRPDLERMGETLAHRGPDGSGVWSEGPVGLGHRMLHATPESLHEKLPLALGDGELTITADARIDNREELILALGMTGRPHEEITDSELILRAYQRWGEACPERLLGGFAFAVWDGRNQVLFCARDHMGVKPFYYHLSGRSFVFGSEIRALLCLPEVPRRLNETRVADYFLDNLEDKTITYYRDILRLPPAHCLVVGRGGTRLWSYWSLDPSRELRLRTNKDYAEAYREVFTEAVRCRLRSAFPVGSMLSGGLDSSSIVCVAREQMLENGNGPLHTLSIIYDDLPEIDERPFINAVLAQGDLVPHYVYGNRISPMTDIDRVLWHQDEAHLGMNFFLHWAALGAVQEQGVRVLLDGFYGDATVSWGMGLMAELARKGRWLALARETREIARTGGVSWRTILWRFGIKPAAPESVRQAWRWLHGRNGQSLVPSEIINPDFARRVGLAERFQAVQEDRHKPARSAREEHWRNLTSGLLPYALELAERAAAAFSVDWRSPFVDIRLAEFCLALPGEQKLHRGLTRMVARRALANTLPEEIRWRASKGRFDVNFTRSLKADLGRVEEVILKDAGCPTEYVNMDALRNVYHRFVSQGGQADGFTLLKMTTLALWLQRTGLTP